MLSRAQHASSTAAQYDPSIEDIRRRIEAVDARARALSSVGVTLRATKDVSQRRLHDLAQTMASLKTQQASAVADAHAQVPRVKCVRVGAVEDGLLLELDCVGARHAVATKHSSSQSPTLPRALQALAQPVRQYFEYSMGLRLPRCCRL